MDRFRRVGAICERCEVEKVGGVCVKHMEAILDMARGVLDMDRIDSSGVPPSCPYSAEHAVNQEVSGE